MDPHPLGDLAREKRASDSSPSEYFDLVEVLTDHGLQASISIKMTAFGDANDVARCESRIFSIADGARDAGLVIELDMEP